jgi:stearoyl-CoA desaturase (delta-9 desaturase)
VWGTRRFQSSDYSTNNLPIALVSLGEGWHNNHHAFPTSARHGLAWWEFDASWIVITLMRSVGLVWNVRLPTASAMAARQCKAPGETGQ